MALREPGVLVDWWGNLRVAAHILLGQGPREADEGELLPRLVPSSGGRQPGRLPGEFAEVAGEPRYCYY